MATACHRTIRAPENGVLLLHSTAKTFRAPLATPGLNCSIVCLKGADHVIRTSILSESAVGRLLLGLAAVPALSATFLPVSASGQTAALGDPLPSWNDGPAKSAIIELVKTTTDKASPNFAPPEARIATFDQDGTTWVEHPIYTQVIYCLERVPAVVATKPELKDVEPFKTVLSGDREAIAQVHAERPRSRSPLATLTGMTVDEFQADVTEWIATAKHPALGPALHRADVPADAGSHAVSARTTATRPTSSPAAARISCASMPSASTAFRPSRWSARRAA